jgi:hypothetical protein
MLSLPLASCVKLMASVSFAISVYAMYMIRWSKFLLFIYSIALCFFFFFREGVLKGWFQLLILNIFHSCHTAMVFKCITERCLWKGFTSWILAGIVEYCVLFSFGLSCFYCETDAVWKLFGCVIFHILTLYPALNTNQCFFLLHFIGAGSDSWSWLFCWCGHNWQKDPEKGAFTTPILDIKLASCIFLFLFLL